MLFLRFCHVEKYIHSQLCFYLREIKLKKVIDFQLSDIDDQTKIIIRLREVDCC